MLRLWLALNRTNPPAPKYQQGNLSFPVKRSSKKETFEKLNTSKQTFKKKNKNKKYCLVERKRSERDGLK